jgi:hypothetical protein
VALELPLLLATPSAAVDLYVSGAGRAVEAEHLDEHVEVPAGPRESLELLDGAADEEEQRKGAAEEQRKGAEWREKGEREGWGEGVVGGG